MAYRRFMSMANNVICAVVMLILMTPGKGWAQAGATGALSGTVLDTSGGVIPNARIQVTDARTAKLVRSVPSSSSGDFVVPLLAPGSYAVVISAEGFGESRIQGVEVRVTETTTLNVVLTASGIAQKVEVSAQVVSVNTENATTGQSIEHQVVGGLPLATQNFQQLLTLSSGAASTLNNSEQLGRGNVRINVNGQREDNNNYLIEGISATDYNVGELTNTPLPSPDVIQEFKVQTSLYDASQGRNGGGMVNAVLRSGTNEWHGDVFEFFRNDVFNANDFFLNRAGQSRPVLKQNIFGVSLGGPLGTEGHFGYLFGNYQGARQRSGADLGTYVSTFLPILPADRSAVSLSQSFFGNATTGIDPVVVKLLNAKGDLFCGSPTGFLIPSGKAPDGNFTCSRAGRFRDDQFTVNWDREFRNHADKISVRWFYSNSEAYKPFGAGGLTTTLGAAPSRTDLNFPLDIPVKSGFLSSTWTHTFSADRVNQFILGYVRINNAYINDPILTASDLGINRPMNNVTNAIYKFTFGTSGFQIGPSPGDQSQIQNNLTLNDVLSWVHGSHRFRFGGEFDKLQMSKQFPQIFNGELFFLGTPANGSTPAYSDFQNFLLGSPQYSFGESGVFDHKYHHNNMSGFIQDDWKATRNLTVNFGLRMEAFGAWADSLYHIGNVDPSLILKGQSPYIYPTGVNQYNVPGLQGTASDSTLDNSYARGWAPRLGIAYDLFGHHTTTIRGGYGIYYAQQDAETVDMLSFSAPILDVVFFPGPPGSLANFFVPTTPPAPANPNGLPPAGVISPAFVPVLSQLTGFVDALGNPTTDTSQYPIYNNNSINLYSLQVPRHFQVPSVQQWNLTIQRALGHNWVFEAGYIGSHTVHLRETHDALQSVLVSSQNPLTVTGAGGTQYVITKNTLANAYARTPYQGINGYSGFQVYTDDAYAHYHSLQTTVSRHWANSYFQAAYTFSRSTDANSSFNVAFNTVFNDQTNPSGSRGLSDFDRPHRLALSYFFGLPFFDRAAGLKGRLLGGWTISGVTIFQSGTPFSILDSAAGTAYDGPATIPTTASLAPGASLSNGLTQGSIGNRLDGYLNLAAFQPAPVIGDDGLATGFGNLGRNTYRGPFEQNWDISIIKGFSIGERQKIRFTTEFFNAWNHPVFSNPAFTDVENPGTFGRIISTENNPRMIQFSLMWTF